MIEIDIWPASPAVEGLEETLRTALDAFGIDEGELSVRLTDDTEIAELNQQYRQKEKPTDVLSFPQIEGLVTAGELENLPGGHLGDIVISLDTAQRQAREYGHDLSKEVRILAAHGLLHLLGYDHDGPDPQAWSEAQIKIEGRIF